MVEMKTDLDFIQQVIGNHEIYLKHRTDIFIKVFFLNFIGVQVLYNTVLVSAEQLSEPTMYTQISLLSLSFPFTSPEQLVEFLCCTVSYHYLFYTQQCRYVNPRLPIYPTTIFPHGVHTLVLYVCVSISALQVSSSVPFFQIPHIFINI